MKSTKNYIVGNFLTIRLYPDFFPVITGCQSIGQRPGYNRTVQGRPALAGRSSGIFFTVNATLAFIYSTMLLLLIFYLKYYSCSYLLYSATLAHLNFTMLLLLIFIVRY